MHHGKEGQREGSCILDDTLQHVHKLSQLINRMQLVRGCTEAFEVAPQLTHLEYDMFPNNNSNGELGLQPGFHLKLSTSKSMKSLTHSQSVGKGLSTMAKSKNMVVWVLGIACVSVMSVYLARMGFSLVALRRTVQLQGGLQAHPRSCRIHRVRSSCGSAASASMRNDLLKALL